MSRTPESGFEAASMLVDAITRHSPMIADALGLSMTPDDLARVERAIVARWVGRNLASGSQVTMDRLLEYMLGE